MSVMLDTLHVGNEGSPQDKKRIKEGRKLSTPTAKNAVWTLCATIGVVLGLLSLNMTVLTLGNLPSEPRPAGLTALLDSQWTAESDQIGANFGYSVSSAGDVNGDGFDDAVVGANNYDNGQTDEGALFLFLGSPSGLSPSYAWMAESDQAYARLGYSVSSAGDVNGDGFDDVIAGAYVYDNGETDEGRAYLYLGSSSGLSNSPSWTDEGDQASAFFGSSVSSAGDVNNDGYDDVLVAALFYSNGESLEGRVFMYLGSATGLSPEPSWIAEGNQAYAYFGRSVSSAGDVNNDGYDDVIIGAYYYDNGQPDEGCAFLYLGSASGLSASPLWVGESDQASAWFGYSVSSAGDVNNDGYDDVVVGAVGYDNPETYEGRAFLYLGSASGLSSSPSWTGESDQTYAYYGVASSAGDVNKDGFGDVIVAAYSYSAGEEDEGRVFLYLGSSSGLAMSPAWTAENNQSSTMFGSSLSCAGDVNNDGYSEVIVGAYNYDNGQKDEGRAFVFYGIMEGPPAEFVLSLVVGWNFIGVPLIGHGYTASSLGLSIGDVVAGWNSSSAYYDRTFIIGISPPSLDFPIKEGAGYWIYSPVKKDLVLRGDLPTTTQHRQCVVPAAGGYVDLSFVGLNSTRRASDIPKMWSGEGGVTYVATYDPISRTYKSYIPGIPFTDYVLIPGQASWCFCTGNGMLTYEP